MTNLPKLRTRRDFDFLLEQVSFGKTNEEIYEMLSTSLWISEVEIFRGREFCKVCHQEININRCSECHQTLDPFYQQKSQGCHLGSNIKSSQGGKK